VPTSNVHSDVQDRVESYTIHMIFARRLRIISKAHNFQFGINIILLHSPDSHSSQVRVGMLHFPFLLCRISSLGRKAYSASIHCYSILHTNIPGLKTPFGNKLFSFFTTTMVWSGFGPYHGLWCEDAPTKHIGVIPTPWTMMHALCLGVFAPQPEL
jgi:hypothetical protein